MKRCMEIRGWLILFFFALLLVFSVGSEPKLMEYETNSSYVYNHTFALVMVEYAAAVYISDMTALFTWTCSRCHGLTEGFEVVQLVVDVESCLQSYVGVAKDPQAVIIAFRGTRGTSIQNWIEDLFWKQLDLDYPGMPGAKVHSGFYRAYHCTTIRPAILNAVKKAKEAYGDLDIIVTGHSMGGAIAAFCALDLIVNHNATNVQVVTFGQPRIGNAAFASYYSKHLPKTTRVTHGHDIVPHLPPYFSMLRRKTYHHFPTEVWLQDTTSKLKCLAHNYETVCDDSGEDPDCSRSVVGNSIQDHLSYYGVDFPTDDPGTCWIVMDPLLVEYESIDSEGNVVLLKNPSTPITQARIAVGK
ncbi:hypothetical protein IC582_026947 [Cucumis melo]|uniref:Lipase-like isoform X1 n=3 Tax=Cucumis melo TaxID=3656 RepID=A0A1S3C7Z0_CUCME|nr:lipase-like isoform X1 [Cucumis melo]